MKKLTTLFIVAILGPSLVLAWLATRSLKDQEMVMRDQVQRRAENMTATVSQDVTVFMDDVRLFYRQHFWVFRCRRNKVDYRCERLVRMLQQKISFTQNIKY